MRRTRWFRYGAAGWCQQFGMLQRTNGKTPGFLSDEFVSLPFLQMFFFLNFCCLTDQARCPDCPGAPPSATCRWAKATPLSTGKPRQGRHFGPCARCCVRGMQDLATAFVVAATAGKGEGESYIIGGANATSLRMQVAAPSRSILSPKLTPCGRRPTDVRHSPSELIAPQRTRSIVRPNVPCPCLSHASPCARPRRRPRLCMWPWLCSCSCPLPVTHSK